MITVYVPDDTGATSVDAPVCFTEEQHVSGVEQSFHLAMLVHAHSVLIRFHIAGFIFEILRGTGAAFANGRCSRGADMDSAVRRDRGSLEPLRSVRLGKGARRS